MKKRELWGAGAPARGAALVALAALWIFRQPAFAYRPFDGTDASVAGAREFELEFGPTHYLREGSDKGIIAPAFIANFWIDGDREIVLES